MLLDPTARFQGNFTSNRIHNEFIILSLAFLGSGILLLLQLLIPSEKIIHAAVITQFVCMVFAFVTVAYLFIKSRIISAAELEKTIEYITAKPQSNPSVTIVRKGRPKKNKKVKKKSVGTNSKKRSVKIPTPSIANIEKS